ncbi:hypothetical protein Tcan_03319 [Toxocara canis]|uniref:Uncharacterized protein n=1 Tax=Toxocara canis TaxID=6265 RepID=A0A0B2VRP5_TOXCA|nr:hypothetical protein Tcan_03319 [Toxocara canis]
MDEQIRLIPSLHATTQPNSAESAVGNISWAFVESCDVQNVPQSSSDMELSPDEYTAISLRTAGSNLSLSAFELFVDSRPIVCESLRRVKPSLLRNGNRLFEQAHVFSALKGSPSMRQMTIAESCSAKGTVVDGFRGYFPTRTAFGTEAILLKQMIDDGGCATILLEFEAHSAVAYFTQPLMGSVTLLDVDNVLFLTSNLRTYFDECSAFVTVQLSPTWVDQSVAHNTFMHAMIAS